MPIMPPTVSGMVSSSNNTHEWSSYQPADTQFPAKLHAMLQFAERMELTYVVYWLPHGRAFKIHNGELFMSQVANKFFKATKLRSIHRQLNIWGFQRGGDNDAWFHENFLRGQPGLTKTMIRTKIKGKALAAQKGNKPNFDRMMSPIEADTHLSFRNEKCTNMLVDGSIKKSHVAMPTLLQPRRVSLPTFSSPELSVDSSPQAHLACHDVHRRVSCSDTEFQCRATEFICRMIEPLPLDSSIETVPFEADEFALFIEQMIRDPCTT